MINRHIIAKSIEHYGAKKQTTVCMEECAELIQAISKEKRGKHNTLHLAEEIADVLICIEILKQVYGITDKCIDTWICKKQSRIIKRMENERCDFMEIVSKKISEYFKNKIDNDQRFIDVVDCNADIQKLLKME